MGKLSRNGHVSVHDLLNYEEYEYAVVDERDLLPDAEKQELYANDVDYYAYPSLTL